MKVTATVVGQAVGVVDMVVEALTDIVVGVAVPAGKLVAVTDEYVPGALLAWHSLGSTLAPDVSHEAGTRPFLRALAVRNAA